jgi:hypothetical protein
MKQENRPLSLIVIIRLIKGKFRNNMLKEKSLMGEWESIRREKIFTEELHTLKDKEYIDEQDYNKIKLAYNLYVQDLDEQKHKIKASLQKQTTIKKKPKPIKTKTVQTAEQIRERNISWSLILGVILLFIGGLVFGTSNWNSMSNLLKVLFVSLVSIIFFATSYIAEKYLNIQKTAFAFMTLGSLFLPISIISIGFFELLGGWLSFHGEGKYVFGFIGSLICLPLYTYLASKYKHRLFVWFAYLTSTIGVGFLLALTYLPRDFFYLGITVYNALLLFAYYKLRHNPRFELFTKELPVYAQLNLILSTLLMLFFFENAVFYSFNILLTAFLYISMVFVQKQKHYHYIFTGLFVYGMYQLIENSFLHSIDYIGFALIGLLYLLFQQYRDKEAYIQKIFQWTSGILSFCAFLFISVQGLLLRSDEDSIVLLFAYLIIAINYICLSNIVKQPIFRYLAPFFLMTAGLQSYFIVFKSSNGSYVELYMFAIATVMYIVLYFKNKFKYFTSIKSSSFVVSIGTMVLTILLAVASVKFVHASILFLAFGFISLFTYKHTLNGQLKKISTWVNPISWGLAWMSLFNYVDQHIAFYRTNVETMGHLALGGLILLAISYMWKTRKQLALHYSTFLTAVALYTISMLTTFLEGYDHPLMTSVIFLVGIAIYTLLVYKIKHVGLWIVVSVTSVVFLSSLTNLFQLEHNETLLAAYNLLIPVILLLIYEFIGRKVQELKPYFFWTAHVYLLGATCVSLFYILFTELNPVLLFITLGAYIYSTLKQTKEWEIKLFLYAAFTTLPFIVFLNILHYQLDRGLTGQYVFLIVTGIIAALWITVPGTWRKRIEWYLIPQSILGLLLFIPFLNDQNVIHLVLFILYTLCTLYLLHRRNWRIVTITPLMIATSFFINYLSYTEKSIKIGFVLVIFFALHQFGKFAHKQLFNSKTKPIQIDWYTITSFGYIILLFLIISDGDPLRLKLIPSLLIVYFLYTLINRFKLVLERRIVKTVTAISLLLPYYTTLREFDLNQYIETELYMLPFILLTIFLSRHTWKDYKEVMSIIQLIILLIVTYILVFDALNSNTLYDAIIIGVLSLASILGGMHYRIKAYFFVGISVLLLNVLLQTRPYWGNFPWWGYLIIAGLTLIGFASFYELQKQKKDTDKKSFLQTKKEQLIKKFKDWD